MAANVKLLNDENFAQETAKGVVLVDFYADWCGPCRMMSPVIEQFAESQAGKVAVVKVDIEASPSVTQQFGITSIPTLVLLKEGKAVGTFVGLKDGPQLNSLVTSSLAKLS